MTSLDLISRAREYRRRNGFLKTLTRIGLSARRSLTTNRMVVYGLELSQLGAQNAHSETGRVERKRDLGEVDSSDLERVLNVWNPRIAQRQFSERFTRGASLWLYKCSNTLAGFGWTLVGRTMEPYFFPLLRKDVHLFDFFVLPEHRGRRVNPSLVNHILVQMAAEGNGRAFIDVAEWNVAQLASLRKTPFHKLGTARRLVMFGWTLILWEGRQLLALPPRAALESEATCKVDPFDL